MTDGPRSAASPAEASTADAAPRAPLAERCVATALEIIAEGGIEALSLRDVARRLGVSHQAPYKHFASRDHLLAEIVRRCFARFNAVMEAAAEGAPDPLEALRAEGRAYLRFALDHPLEYRLMFGDTLPDPAQHPEMLAECHMAFDGLRRCVCAILRCAPEDPRVLPEALAVWSAVHGYATIRQTPALETLGLGPIDDDALAEALLARICASLDRARGA